MVNPRKIAWICGLGGLASLLAGACFVRHVDRRWQEFGAQVDALQERLEAADTSRPVLYGKGTPGNAWSAYQKAIALAAADPGLEKQVRPYVRATMKPEAIATLIGKHGEILEQLRRGAHCEQAREPVAWPKGCLHSSQNLLTVRGLGNLAVTKALAQAADGHPEAAAKTLLDAAQLGRDLMHSHLFINEVIGCAILHISTSEAMQNNELLQRLAPEGLDRLASGLALLDGGIERVGPSFHGEAVLGARTFQSPDLVRELDLSGGAWRYGMSSRLMFAAAGQQMMEYANRTVAAGRSPWSLCDDYLTRREAELADAHDLFVDPITHRTMLVQRFQAIARVRLLRMWIEHRRGRPIPELEDPFGGSLGHESGDDGRIRFVSLGPDGNRDLFLFRRRP